MNRRATLVLTTGMLCSAGGLLANSRIAPAQQSDIEKIKAVRDGSLEALHALDVRKMEEFWARDDHVTFIGPRDKTITRGWNAVRKKLEGIVAFWSELEHKTLEGPYIHQNGETAWVHSVVLNLGKPRSGAPPNPFMAFNASIMEKRGERWLIVSASAWRMSQ